MDRLVLDNQVVGKDGTGSSKLNFSFCSADLDKARFTRNGCSDKANGDIKIGPACALDATNV